MRKHKKSCKSQTARQTNSLFEGKGSSGGFAAETVTVAAISLLLFLLPAFVLQHQHARFGF